MAAIIYCRDAPGHPWHQPYHDLEYGYPVADDRVLFERMVLEINQAGLSWLTVLKKREALNAAFDGFEIDRVAAYGDAERARLLADAGIIRNRRKIDAIIENARRLVALRAEQGSFAAWLAEHHPRSKAAWLTLFRARFTFMGGEVVGEFLMSIGYLPGAHQRSCPVFSRLEALNPPWLSAVATGFDGYGDEPRD
ncbi:MAG: DNA-3-methyladenine glycosylase I [Rhodospirillaceae bacterium]